ncbi:MAG: UPF0175 family protein [Cyclobacteriaceae bacterium]|nr:UPF0175 family protein [Cyclobacteriaceae bacterium]
MDTKTISIEFPPDILLALNESEAEFKKRVKVALAVRLYKLQKLTLGKSAQLAGMSRYEFENVLSENEVPISQLTLDDVLNDADKIRG